jgi:putative phosphoribosyl transferase
MGGFLDGSWRPSGEGRFLNRYDAGRGLAAALGPKLAELEGKGVVVGLPRGGLVVGLAVSNDLKLPLDFRAVRKVGHPYQPEFAIGAVDISGVVVRNPMVEAIDMPPDVEFERMVQQALDEARTMEKELRGDGPSYLKDSDWCLVVDDGAATGLTLLAVVKGIKGEGKKAHVGIPVASTQARSLIAEAADSFCALHVPQYFMAVSQFYDDFAPVTTDEARRCLG